MRARGRGRGRGGGEHDGASVVRPPRHASAPVVRTIRTQARTAAIWYRACSRWCPSYCCCCVQLPLLRTAATAADEAACRLAFSAASAHCWQQTRRQRRQTLTAPFSHSTPDKHGPGWFPQQSSLPPSIADRPTHFCLCVQSTARCRTRERTEGWATERGMGY
jgi:hypothetical protein